jgi:hypothetical protein
MASITHAVIVHHADGECSTEGEFEHRDMAVLAATLIAEKLDKREFVTVLGYTFQGKR